MGVRWPFRQRRFYHLISCINLSLKREAAMNHRWIHRIFTHVNFYSAISPFGAALSWLSVNSFPSFSKQNSLSEREMRRRSKDSKSAINHNFLTISSFYNFLRYTFFFLRKILSSTPCLKRISAEKKPREMEMKRKRLQPMVSIKAEQTTKISSYLHSY